MTENKSMSKADVIAHFAKTFGMPRGMARDMLNELVELSIRETKEKGSFSLPGIGKLSLSDRAARIGRNPRTGEAVQVPAKKVVKLRLSKIFKDSFAEQEQEKEKAVSPE